MRPVTIIVSLALAACAAPVAEPVELVRHTVEADGHPIAVWEKSPPDPTGVVVLVHGRTWSSVPDFDLQVPGEEKSLMDGLVAEGFATYGVDLRGYGGTPRDETGWLTPNRAAADVAAVLEWVAARSPGTAPPYLFGWSLGSMVSQLTVQQRPELVTGVILFGYPFRPDRPIRLQEEGGEPLRLANTAEAAASDFIVEGAISQLAIDTYVAAALAADSIKVDWRGSAEWEQLDPARVTVPTLLLQGEFDPLAPTDAQAAFFAAAGSPDRQWVIVPGGDHAAFLETPRAYFLDALVNFMRRPRSADRSAP